MEILDLTKSEVDNVFRLINLANHTDLDSTLYTLSNPVFYTDPNQKKK